MEFIWDSKKLEELIGLCLDSLNKTHNARLVLDNYNKLDDRYVFWFRIERQESVIVPFLFDEIVNATYPKSNKKDKTSHCTLVKMDGLNDRGQVLVGKYFIKKIWDTIKHKI